MFREYPSFQMESTNVTLLTGVILMLNRITPSPLFQIQSTNATLLAGIIFCLKEYPPPFFQM